MQKEEDLNIKKVDSEGDELNEKAMNTENDYGFDPDKFPPSIEEAKRHAVI